MGIAGTHFVLIFNAFTVTTPVTFVPAFSVGWGFG